MRVSLLDKIFSSFIASRGEKRKEPRREAEIPVEIEILSDESQSDHSSVLYAEIKDISAGGVKILTCVNIPIGTSVRIKITLLKLGETIGPIGKVVWGHQIDNSDLYEMGIEFESTQPEILCILLEYIYTDWE